MPILRDEFTVLISTLNAEKFRAFIQTYLRNKYLGNDIYITDGPYDGGNDLTIIANGREIKKNFQVTIQKDNIEKKINEDLGKAKANVVNYAYMRKLDFYYNQKLSNVFREGGDSDECDHPVPFQAHHPFRGKLTRVFRG